MTTEPSRSPGADEPLDDPVGRALRGHHTPYAVVVGSARRYHPDVAPFAALGPRPGPKEWADLATLVGPAGGVALVGPPTLPAGWSALMTFSALQMVSPRPGQADAPGAPDTAATEATARGAVEVAALLTAGDREDAQDLARRTEPGPFGPRTMELGRFLGVRQGGRLVAMAGERMHPPGWTEVSGVCTDPSARGQGLASRLVADLTAGIHARGESAFLHVLEANTGAVRVYAALGYTAHRAVPILVVRPPH